MHFLIEILNHKKEMKIKYFEDTDTALLEFSDNPIFETKELYEDIYLDLDAKGNVVSITLEHADRKSDLSEFSFLRIKSKSANKTLELTANAVAQL
jgi:uncharacterized protein YuzE